MQELDDDGLKVSKKVVNEDLTRLLLGIRVLYMVEGFQASMLISYYLGHMTFKIISIFAAHNTEVKVKEFDNVGCLIHHSFFVHIGFKFKCFGKDSI